LCRVRGRTFFSRTRLCDIFPRVRKSKMLRQVFLAACVASAAAFAPAALPTATRRASTVSGEARARPLFPQVLAQNPSCTGRGFHDARTMRLLEHCGRWAAMSHKANAEAAGCSRRTRGADGWRTGRGLSILSWRRWPCPIALPNAQGNGVAIGGEVRCKWRDTTRHCWNGGGWRECYWERESASIGLHAVLRDT
jgi:hypothetical protein